MTREEAINKIRQWSLPKETRDILEALAPELRENEDENLKNKGGYYKAGKFWKASTLWNATKNKVPQRVSNRYILQECTWNIGTLQRFADEVKNVQEVSLDYPIILDMNGNIIDGAHRVVKAYLEGKDIDIVYIGDDEWPEPDYDEEKAIKESDDERIKKSLIKFLTDIKEISESGRTTWAVRKEDAEMCKSFIAWLEKQKEPENVSASTMIPSCWEVKQKEQKPVNHNLTTFHRDVVYAAMCNKNLDEGLRCNLEMVYKTIKELVDRAPVIREQKSAVRPKATINGGPIPTETQSVNIPLAEWSEEDEGELQNAIDALEFLGKKGVYRSESGYDAALQAASWLKSLSERFNLQRKVEWSDEDKRMLNHLIDKIQENWNIRMPDGYSFGISNDEKETFSSWLRCLPERFNLSPKQEWSEEDEAAYNAFICEVINEKMNPTVEQVKWLRSICDRLKSFYPQSKQEWNNEDESMLNTIITDVGFVQRKCGIGTDEWNVRSKAIQWLKNLLKRFNTPKQEWKEVELEFHGEKVKVKRPFFRDDKGREYSTTEQDEDVAWYALRAWCDKKGISLYDLYPKNEWSEEDEIMLNNIIRCLPSKSISEFNLKRINWLKSLRPSWKPSKEQMDSLRDTIANTKGYSYSIYLPELYEQLKKLV